MAKQQKNTQSKSNEITPKPNITIHRLPYILLAGLSVLTLVAFMGGFHNDFVDWDDHVYIQDNLLVTNASWQSIKKAFTTSIALNYHPFTIVSLIFNTMLAGGWQKPAPFIITNTIIHVLNVCLVFVLARKLSSKNIFIATVTALLFAIHPMRVESVIWVSERKDVLYGSFFLLGLNFYWNFLEIKNKKWLFFAFFAFVASSFSKAQAVCFPLIMLLFDYWKGEKITLKLLLPKLSFLVVALIFGIIAMNIQSGENLGGAMQTVGLQRQALDLKVFTVGERIQYAAYGYIMYFYKLLVPFNLSPFYPYEAAGTGNARFYWVGLLFLPIVLGLTFWSTARTKIVLFGIGFYSISVALVLQFISVGAAIMADRYTYIPYFGLFFLIAYGLDKLIKSNQLFRYPVWLGVAIISIGLFTVTKEQVLVWKNSGTLFTRVIDNFPNDQRPFTTRGRYFGMNGNLDQGIADLERALLLGNKEASTYDNLGTGYAIKGKITEAIDMWTKSIAAGPTDANPFLNRANAFAQRKEFDKAIADYEMSLKYSPNQEAFIRENLGMIYLNIGKNQIAFEQLNKVIAMGVEKAEVYYYRAIGYLQLNNREAARVDLQHALQLKPDLMPAQEQLKALLH